MPRTDRQEELRKSRRLRLEQNGRQLTWANRVIDAAQKRGKADGESARIADLEEALRVAVALLDGRQLQQHMQLLGAFVRDWS